MSNNQPKKHYLSVAEEDMIALWNKEKTFQKSVENREGKETFSFYDGPPYANGLPHHGHLVPVTLKDSITRYKTMRGYYVPRRTGWDCHGLPIEYKIEQEKGFQSKKDIIDYGIEKFNQACKDSVFQYKTEWEKFFERVGRWADFDNSYATLDSSYIESVWWAFAQIYKKGLVYEDFRSTPYCPRCATPLSNFEVNQGYQDGVKDPSLFVKFKLKGDDRKLLAWTTTPWSLPGNAAIAVNTGEIYVTVRVKTDGGDEERLILAEKRLSILDEEYELEGEISGEELVGLSYEPLFDLDKTKFDTESDNLYKVWPAEFVSVDDGSGVLHVAPAFGEDDLVLGKENDIPVLSTVDTNGKIEKGIGFDDIAGLFFKHADKRIIEYLTKENGVFAAETIEHTYPFCWRCDSPLLYYATNSWFIAVSKVRDNLVSNNKEINWVPEHVRDGRFGKWLEGARDWAFSRNRFWGAPLPIWRTEDGELIVVESIEELRELADDSSNLEDLHRPFIDQVVITTKGGKKAHRVEEVFDVWFESGAMPYGQDHYPFENKDKTEKNFPADFIAEAMDQTRGWFYSLHVIATTIFDKPAFKNVVVNGWVNAADGQKLSKRKKNYTPLDDVFDQFGSDSMRFFMMSSPIVHGEDIKFSSQSLKEIQRNIFLTLQNTYNFFKMYRDIDGWKPSKATLTAPTSESSLDTWILSRTEQTISEVTKHADRYEVDKATRPIKDLLDDVSNWYVRRSRRRFWKSEDDSDKNSAYETLYYVLVRMTQLLAPWSPFMSDRIYRELVANTDEPKSVHLSDWPEAGGVDTQTLQQMELARDVIATGLAQRAEAKIKVRQPLSALNVVLKAPLPQEYLDIIAEEVNVKDVHFEGVGTANSVDLITTLDDNLISEGIARDLVRQIQSFRKKSGLEVDDRINLAVISKDQKVTEAVKTHKKLLMTETLASVLETELISDNVLDFELNGSEIKLSIEKS